MSGSANLEDLRRRYFVGLAKSGSEVSADTLAAFTLAAMRSRFARQPHRQGENNVGIILSCEPLLPDAARPLLIRVCAAKQTDQLAGAAARAFYHAGVRPHPFDFYRLEEFVVRFAPDLGATAQAWAGRIQPSQPPAPAGDEEPVTEDTFTNASRAAKIVFLRTLRRTEPDRARAIIAQHFSQEPAASRSDFLDVLTIRLGADDLNVLNAAASDKAQSVRTKAETMLKRVPGTSRYRERLTRLPDYIKVKTALLSRKKTLSLIGLGEPVAVKLGALCDGLRLSDFAESLGLSIEDLATAAAGVAGLEEVIFNAIVAERKFELIRCFEAVLDDPGWLTGNALRAALVHASPSDRNSLVQMLIQPKRWSKMPETFTLQRLGDMLAAPLPDAIAKDLLDAKVYKDMLARDASPALTAQIESLAPLIPRALSESFIADVRQLSPRASWFHRFLLALPRTSG